MLKKMYNPMSQVFKYLSISIVFMFIGYLFGLINSEVINYRVVNNSLRVLLWNNRQIRIWKEDIMLWVVSWVTE